MKLLAAQRLLTTNADDTVTESSNDDSEITAEFNTERGADLRKIQIGLRNNCKMLFSMDSHHLFHKSNSKDVIEEAKCTVEELNRLGWALRVNPGIYDKAVFALKGKDGLVLQRVNNNLRIFFSSPSK